MSSYLRVAKRLKSEQHARNVVAQRFHGREKVCVELRVLVSGQTDRERERGGGTVPSMDVRRGV